MHKIYQNITNKKDNRIFYKIECLECGHISWIPKYKIDSTWLCPVCKNLGSIFNRISKRYHIDTNGCHVWEGTQTKDGYAIITFKSKKVRVARVVLENKIGRILKENHETCHICNNRICINPDHLYEGTHKRNGYDLSLSKIISGDNCPHVKINEKVAAIIKKRIYLGEPTIKIARELNVKSSIIDNIKRERSWKWLKI
jgi:hypothetical protein